LPESTEFHEIKQLEKTIELTGQHLFHDSQHLPDAIKTDWNYISPKNQLIISHQSSILDMAFFPKNFSSFSW